MPAMRMVWINPDLETEVLLGELYPNARWFDFTSLRIRELYNDSWFPTWLFDTVSKKRDNRGWGNIKVKTIGCSRD